MKKFSLLLAFLTSFSAQAITGEKLLEMCDAGREFCDGYVWSVVDNVVTSNETSKFFCIPKGVSSVQTKKVVIKYMEKNPENLHWTATALVHNALLEAFRCPSK